MFLKSHTNYAMVLRLTDKLLNEDILHLRRLKLLCERFKMKENKHIYLQHTEKIVQPDKS